MALLLFLVVANGFAAYYVGQERYVYFYDTSNYWLKFDFVGNSFKQDLFQAVIWLISSIRREDYNNLPAFFLLPFHYLFGSNRTPFILAIVNTFLFPAAATLMLLYRAFMKKADLGWPSWAPFLWAFTVLLYPLFVSPVLIGYVDVGGVFITNCVLLIYFTRPFSEQKPVHLVVLGLLLSLAVLFRRWYAYWLVSFYVAVAWEVLRYSSDGHRPLLERLKRPAAKLLFMGLVSAAFLLVIAWPIVFRMVTSDYSYLYSYMRSSVNLLQSLQKFCWQFGPFHILLFVGGFLAACVNTATRRCAIFLSIQWVIMFVLFSRVQDFETHQFYLLEPSMLLFQLLFVSVVLDKVKKRLRQIGLALIYCLTTVVIFVNVFVPSLPPYLKLMKPLLPKQAHYPLHRDDLAQLERLVGRLRSLLKDPADKVYVFPSSDIFNSEVLTNVHRSIGQKWTFEPQILWTHSVDKRDRFPKGLLSARYVVVCDPIINLKRASDSLVVGIPAAMLLNGEGFGRSYKKLSDVFLLDKGIQAFIYEKVAPIEPSDIRSLENIFRRHYPEWGDRWIAD